MTFEYKIIPVNSRNFEAPYEINGFSERKQTVSRKLKRDRRKQKKDRRKSIRDGVIVSLSTQNNRRKGTDRRKQPISRFA